VKIGHYGNITSHGVILKIKVQGQFGMQFQVKGNWHNEDMKLFSLPNNSVTLLNAELNAHI
jgi:hypothetical protein